MPWSSCFLSSVTLNVYLPYQTEFCGWGVVAAEKFNKGDFIIEYIGEGTCFIWLKLKFSTAYIPLFACFILLSVWLYSHE